MAVDGATFRTDTWTQALVSYSAATHLTVTLTGLDGAPLRGPTAPSPLFDLFAGRDRDPGLVEACARRCWNQTGPGAPVVEERYGLAVVGTPLRRDGEIVGAAVAAYVLTVFPDQLQAQRLAAQSTVPFDTLWYTLRRQLPLAHERVLVYGELLQTLCTALLSENDRARQLQEASDRLVAEAHAKDSFLAVLSHELRTPLTAVLGWVRMLRSGRLDARASGRAIDVIERNAKRQAELIDELLHVSRIISGKVVLDVRPVWLVPIVDAAVDAFRPAAQLKGVRIDVILDADAAPVSADPDRIGQVISNLVSNAIKFTPSGGRVEVRLSRAERDVQLTVMDSGVGISREFLPLVFERFRQAESAVTRIYGGLGLGLAIVHHLVELHGGTVSAASPGTGQGATFTVRLPALEGAKEMVGRDLTPIRDQSMRGDDVPTLEGVRVLIVDDEADGRDLFTSVLEKCQAEVMAASSVAETLTILERWRPDVLISDIGLPGESGYDLIQKIRLLPAERGGTVPAMAVTAYAHPEDGRHVLAAGYQLHVAKPVEPLALVLAVVELMAHRKVA